MESVIGFYDNAPDFESSFMKKYLNDFHENLKKEADMKLELERMNKYGEMVNWVSAGSGRTPDWGMASKNVMVMELVKGDVVSDLIERGEGAKASRVYKKACGIWKDVIKNKGLLHGDIHPGNVMVVEKKGGEDSIVFLDFGSVMPNCHNISGIGDFVRLLKVWIESEKNKGFPGVASFSSRCDYIAGQLGVLDKRDEVSKEIKRRFERDRDGEACVNYLNALYHKSQVLSHNDNSEGSILKEAFELYLTCFKHQPEMSEEGLRRGFIYHLADATSLDSLGVLCGYGKYRDLLSESEILAYIHSDQRMSGKVFSCLMEHFSPVFPSEYSYYLQCKARIDAFNAKEIENGSINVSGSEKSVSVQREREEQRFKRPMPEDKNYLDDLRKRYRVPPIFSDKFVWLTYLNDTKPPYVDPEYLRSKKPAMTQTKALPGKDKTRAEKGGDCYGKGLVSEKTENLDSKKGIDTTLSDFKKRLSAIEDKIFYLQGDLRDKDTLLSLQKELDELYTWRVWAKSPRDVTGRARNLRWKIKVRLDSLAYLKQDSKQSVGGKKHYQRFATDDISAVQLDALINEKRNNSYSDGTRLKALEWWVLDRDRRGARAQYSESHICDLYIDYLQGIYNQKRKNNLLKLRHVEGMLAKYHEEKRKTKTIPCNHQARP